MIFTEINGKQNVATFRYKAQHILQEYYTNSKKGTNLDQEKQTIICTASKLIKEDIKCVQTDHTKYPDLTNDLSDAQECLNFVPPSLVLFLETLILKKSSDLLKASLGQALMQATRPRVIQAPMQIGLGAQLDWITTVDRHLT